jgi:hypothetical protein
MCKIRDVLRLSASGMSKRQIAASLGIGATAAGNTSGGRVMLVWESRSRQPF